jgi:sensor domain CHASE-containing protein
MKKFLTLDLNNITNYPNELALNSNFTKINQHLSNRINSSLTKVNKIGALINLNPNVSEKNVRKTTNLTKTFFYSHSKNTLRKPHNMRFGK